jgi:hypothetical protein
MNSVAAAFPNRQLRAIPDNLNTHKKNEHWHKAHLNQSGLDESCALIARCNPPFQCLPMLNCSRRGRAVVVGKFAAVLTILPSDRF